MTKISSSTIDQALANLSDLPVVSRDYDFGYNGTTAGLAIRFPNAEGGDDAVDAVRFFLDLARNDDEAAEALFEALTIDRPSYRGNVWVFPSITLEGTSIYETEEV